MQVLYAPEACGDTVHVVVVAHAIRIKDKYFTARGEFKLSKINFYLILLSATSLPLKFSCYEKNMLPLPAVPGIFFAGIVAGAKQQFPRSSFIAILKGNGSFRAQT